MLVFFGCGASPRSTARTSSSKISASSSATSTPRVGSSLHRVIQLFAAFSIWSGGQFGRWIGIIAARLSAIGALLSIPRYPSFWSLAVFGVDLLITYGLSAHGGQRARTA
jgi:hypothetical protein